MAKSGSSSKREPGRALITGASAGIGADLAHVFARHGHDLVLVARREDALEKLAGQLQDKHDIQVDVIASDLTRKTAVAALVKEAQAERPVEILVNNAGVTDVRLFADAPTSAVLGLIDLNMRVLTELTNRMLPEMVEQRRGRILNVASLAAFQPLPRSAIYAASKAYVLSFTQALAEELRGTGVSITALCPGFTETDMADQFQGPKAGLPTLPRQLLADPASVAAEGYRALMASQVVAVPGLGNQMAATWAELTPSWITSRLLGLAMPR